MSTLIYLVTGALIMVVQEVEQDPEIRDRTFLDGQKSPPASARCGAYLRRAGRCLERYLFRV
jgi:hypothetical protein